MKRTCVSQGSKTMTQLSAKTAKPISTIVLKELTKSRNIKYKCGHSVPINVLFFNTKTNKIIITKPCGICKAINTNGRISVPVNEFSKKFQEGAYKLVIDKDGNSYDEIRFDYPFGVELECFIKTKRIEEIVESALDTNTDIKDLIDVVSIIRSFTKTRRPKAKEKLCPVNIDQTLKKWRFGYDGSLYTNDQNKMAFELKSHILTGDKGLKSISDMVSLVDPTFNTTTGLHVHIKPNFDIRRNIETYQKFLLLSYVLDAFYFRWRVQQHRRTSRYAVIQLGYSHYEIDEFIRMLRLGYHTCTCPTNESELSNNIGRTRCVFCRTSLFIKGGTYNGSANGNATDLLVKTTFPFSHGSSTSLSRHGTVEFRLMHGTNDIDFIKGMINEYMSELYLIDTMNVSDLQEEIKSILDLSGSFDDQKTKLTALVSDIKRAPTEQERFENIKLRLKTMLDRAIPSNQ